MITYYLLATGTAVLFTVGYILANKLIKADESKKAWLLKGLALLFSAIFACRYMGGKIVLTDTYGLNVHSPFGTKGQTLTMLSVFTLWFTFTAYSLLVLYPFFKTKVGFITPLVKFFASIVYLVDLCTINMQIQAMWGVEKVNSFSVQGLFFALETGIALAMCVAVWVKEYKTPFHLKRLIKNSVFLVLMIVVSMPVFVLQTLYGTGNKAILLESFTVYHRLALYGLFVAIAIVIALLNKYDYQRKRFALLYLSIATMTTYSYYLSYESFFDATSWPLHLCNTAMYIVPLCLIFKLNKVFYFTLFINVLGAFFAMVFPNINSYIFETESVRFWINHYCAFVMPIAIIGLKMYDRPKMKLFTYSLIAFAFYYALVLFMNAWLTNYDEGVDFFFINSDFIAEKLGKWAEDLRNFTWVFTPKENITMTIYPIYQSLYFVVYIVLSFAMWFLYELAFEVEDLYVDIYRRNKKIKVDRLALEVNLAGRNIAEPLNMDGINKLILRNFSKQYASSDVYAVHNANLEIEGGQIFGFLGPNGAGKSTIIKSIVGIQGISSGSIEVCGYDVEKQPVGAKLQTGFVPDHYALYENLTGREYVNYIADLYNVSKEDRTARIEEYVERFRLQGSFDNPIKTYSHGMKQKITIMSALVHNPRLWILDEPLTGLDPESIFQVKEAMKKHAKEGNIVFFSSHIIDVVERICDKIAIIKKGHILCQMSVKELEEKGLQLENFYMDMIENTNVDSDPIKETTKPEIKGAEA